VTTDGQPTRLIEAWIAVTLAVVVDAVRDQPSQPAKVHRSRSTGPAPAPRERPARPGTRVPV